MMGLNQTGQIKVWMNSDFSKNHPDFSKIDHNQGEAEFVLRLFTIYGKIISPTHPNTFINFIIARIAKIGQLKFETALVCL